MSRPLSEVVIDVNDVTERDAFISAAGGAKYPAWELARARAASTGRISRTDALYRSLSRPCGQSVPYRAAYGIVAAVAVPVVSRCAVVVLRSAADFGRLCRTSSAR